MAAVNGHGSPKTVHGVLLSVDRHIGVLLTGPSGSGKSALAASLLDRGHRLVADDVIEVTTSDDDATRIGRCPTMTHALMHLRGIGVIDVRQHFGPDAWLDSHRIDLHIEITAHWPENDRSETQDVDVDHHRRAASDSMPLALVPHRLAMPPALWIEIAAREWYWRTTGRSAGHQWLERHSNRLMEHHSCA